MVKNFSQHCENNKQVINNVLVDAFKDCTQILEIGSGTGQHAIFFASHLPNAIWHTSVQSTYIESLTTNLLASNLANIRSPLVLDVTKPWPLEKGIHAIDGIFTANSLHIMSAAMVESFFNGMGEHLKQGGQLCIYGPFNYNGNNTSDSNAAFDVRLKENNTLSGIKDFEWICDLAKAQGLILQGDHEMPANNRVLHFFKSTTNK